MWATSYTPQSFDALAFTPPSVRQLKILAQNKDFPHLIFVGQPGSGRRTLMRNFMRQLHGDDVDKVVSEIKTVKVGYSKTIEVPVRRSLHHIEITPSDFQQNDKLVIQTAVKDIAATLTVTNALRASAFLEQPGPGTTPVRGFRLIVVHDAQLLSDEAQQALRRTMEQFVDNCRILFVATTVARLKPPIQSRCLCVRVGAPAVDDIVAVLQRIARAESFRVPRRYATKIAQGCGRDLRRAIHTMQTMRLHQMEFKANVPLPMLEWEDFVRAMAMDIVAEQHSKMFLDIRNRLYTLIINRINTTTILKRLASELATAVDDDEVKMRIYELACKYDHRMCRGNKAVLHLQGFVGESMALFGRMQPS